MQVALVHNDAKKFKAGQFELPKLSGSANNQFIGGFQTFFAAQIREVPRQLNDIDGLFSKGTSLLSSLDPVVAPLISCAKDNRVDALVLFNAVADLFVKQRKKDRQLDTGVLAVLEEYTLLLLLE